jgi:ferritin
MLSETLLNAINEQIEHELFSSNLYLAMASYFEEQSLPGFAGWVRVQSEEERGHALKFIAYLNDVGEHVKIHAISEPPSEWNGALDVFENVLRHEQKVTSLIHTLYELALKDKDYRTQSMLKWFIDEQVEEEKNACLIVEQLRMLTDQRAIILHLDHRFGKRGGE